MFIRKAIEMGDSPRQAMMVKAVTSLSIAAYLCDEESNTSLCDAYEERAALILRTWFEPSKEWV